MAFSQLALVVWNVWIGVSLTNHFTVQNFLTGDLGQPTSVTPKSLIRIKIRDGFWVQMTLRDLVLDQMRGTRKDGENPNSDTRSRASN